MREIKFRAYNKKRKEMKQCTQSWWIWYWKHSSRKEQEIMQFTGLKDKNGKEIYEGDIVKYQDRLFEIKWEEEFAGFDIDVGIINSSNIKNYFEVIGNIWENGDLLNDTK